MGLDADPSKEKLQEFVRCAAMELESRAFVFPPDPSREWGSLRRRRYRSGRFSTLVLVKGPAGLLKAHFLDELVGALNERFNALRGANGASSDGVIRARQWFSGAPGQRESA